MNGKFELSSNDYDESNLNRPHSVLGAGVVAGDSIASDEIRMEAASVARASAATPGLCLREDLAYRMRSCGLQFPQRHLFESAQQHLFAVGHAGTPCASPLNEPLEYTNSEDCQEEEGQEGSENGDEFAGTMQVEEALRTYDFEEDVSARDQNAKGPHG
jgi:hypothetical protein